MEELAGNLILDEKMLLLLYRKDEEHWEVPGGKVEENESPAQAAVREAEEEIGAEIELKKPFYTGEFQHDNQIFVWHAYVSEIQQRRPEVQESKFEELRWVEPGELDELDLAPNLEMILPALRKISRS